MKGGEKMNLQAQKKDGSLEPFDRNKIKNGLIKSGASEAEAESITSQAETWAQTTAVNNIVKTADIRTKVLELLRSANPTVAASFEAYQKPV